MTQGKQIQIILRQFIQVYEQRRKVMLLEIEDPQKYSFENWSTKTSFKSGFNEAMAEAIKTIREALGEK